MGSAGDTGPLRHLLLDADDVLQQGTSSFRAELESSLGEGTMDWLRATFRPDRDVLAGRTSVVDLLDERLGVARAGADARALYDRIWLDITPYQPVLDLVANWRAAGLTVHLATNQDRGRAAYMKRALGYADLLDGAYYSSDLGVAKPSADFFATILADLGAPAGSVAFVDDLSANVAGAQEVGLRAVRWEIADGTEALLARLASVGLR